MIKSELILRIAAQNPHLYEKDVAAIVNTIFNRITDALMDGDRVELRGLGVFSLRTRDAREGRNPKTGAPVTVGEKKTVAFKTGKAMQARLSGSEEHATPVLQGDAQWQSRWLGKGPAPAKRRT